MVRRYGAEMMVRLDPTDAQRFEPMNARLGPRGAAARVLLFGDSRIAEWRPTFERQGIEIVNRGNPGETTAQALLRLERDVLSLDPEIVVIQSGINDLKAIGVFPERAAEIEASCARGLRTLVGRLTERGVRVVFLTIFPVAPVSWERSLVWSDETIDAADRINREWIKAGAANVAVVDCDRVLRMPGSPYIRPDMSRDELHLNARGYAAIDMRVTPVIERLLGEKRGAVQ